jgi:hypothetical protein
VLRAIGCCGSNNYHCRNAKNESKKNRNKLSHF